jgi:hypothetical protein
MNLYSCGRALPPIIKTLLIVKWGPEIFSEFLHDPYLKPGG